MKKAHIALTVLTAVFIMSLLVMADKDRKEAESRTQTYTVETGGSATQVEVLSAPVQRTTSKGTPINDSFNWSSVSMQSTPESSCFSEIGYDSRHEVLVVTFRDSGASYAYYDVPDYVWDDLESAKSKGGYYNSDIKGYYDCEKLG